MAIVFIGLGSNLGNRKEQIEKSLKELSLVQDCQLLATSSLYETSPVSTIQQGNFLNAVCVLKTSLSPLQLLLRLQEIEKKLGKLVVAKNGPRAIDIDLLFFDQTTLDSPRLVIPHPRLYDRLFVLVPLLELSLTYPCPLPLPELKERIAYLKTHSDQSIQFYPL